MSDSLDAACGQFEQIIIGQMLRTAEFVERPEPDENSGDDADGSVGGQAAFAQLVDQALSAALERAGGIGLRRSLSRTMRGGRS